MEIGKVADGATESGCNVILYKDMEKTVRAEELVLIKNGGPEAPGGLLLGVLRRGLGKNEFLNPSSYKPDLAYLKYGGEPSSAREVFSFYIAVIGEIVKKGERNSVTINRRIIAPRSPVYVFGSENPLELYLSSDIERVRPLRAFLKDHENWRMSADSYYIPYHVGVYGTTGSGKSWLARHVLIPFYREAGYGIIVLDWSGTDYAPYSMGDVLKLSEISQDQDSVLEYFKELTHGFYENKNVQLAFEDIASEWESIIMNKGNAGELRGEIERRLNEFPSQFEMRKDVEASYRSTLRFILRRITEERLLPLMGRTGVDEVINRAFRGQAIVDMGDLPPEIKLSFFLTLGERIYGMINRGEFQKVAIIIDEAPQYAPFKPEGLQAQTTDLIRDLAALGRKHNLNLTLLSQGVAGEIGINAAIRRNLNTNFYGRLHPLDLSSEGGAAGWLAPYGITTEYLINLDTGNFYFAGLMNPSPVPLLLEFRPMGYD